MPTLFTDRRNGHSRAPYESFNLALHVGDDPLVVAQNRDDLKALSAPLQFMNQVHGDDVVVVNELISEPTADALITQNPDIALAVMVADCIPLLLVSDLVIAAVHVGRRGLVNGIALKTVSKMRELGAIEIRAELGPSICGKCYEVPQDLADDFIQAAYDFGAYEAETERNIRLEDKVLNEIRKIVRGAINKVIK